jgi:hypothetical protein
VNEIEMDAVWDMPTGVTVISADGEFIGAVTQTDGYELLVMDTRLRQCTYALNLIDVDRFEGGVLYLKLTMAEAVEGRCVA